ncbi:DUF4145 domain-containing protein [Shewanella aestuarii]|uniref:DUF4145 domain-containing protein n=1 Tax=Shewanella aestuarii TaxID=1028752 RepID=A0A6G9QP93_9GAMM|nr:tetratricopeptide repeat protein [Shewanella aestuarii]QIR15875.1 DUF4145 domain-containing protein [Shewanella aestuarii]
MITDIEFVSQFSTELGEDYACAKSYVRDIPTQALVFVRSFTHKLAALVAKQQQLQFTSPNLYDRIEQLNQHRLLDVTAIRAMHKLRADGNRGAHPEKYHLTQAQLVALAEKSIHQILALVSKVSAQLCEQALPKYRFVAFDSFAGRDLCYRAMMHNDHHAQYLVAMSFKAQALMAQEQANTVSLDQTSVDNTAAEVQRLFSQAAYWFAQAAPFEDAALFEHGVSLLHGYDQISAVANAHPSKEDAQAQQKAQSKQGELFIAKAASVGVVEAQALLGYFYLVGSQAFKVDLAKAQTLLTQAAEAENVEAMSNLGVLFYQSQQLEQAYLWVNKAAQSGYPHAMYHLALMLANGEGCQQDEAESDRWLQEAASQGQLDAMLHCATQILHDDCASKEALVKAEAYLHDVIKYGHNVAAMIELSVALADGILGRIDVMQSAYLLTQAKLHAMQNSNEIQLQVIEPLWQSLLMQIERVIELTPSEDELTALLEAKRLLI